MPGPVSNLQCCRRRSNRNDGDGNDGSGNGIDWRAVGGEFLATGLFVWAGCGAAVSSDRWGSDQFSTAELNTISMTFGLAITVLAYSFGHISGGHMNPAVTLSFVMLGAMKPVVGVLYVIAQCLGAWMGALVLWGCTASLVYQCETNDWQTKPTRSGVCAASVTPEGDYGAPFGLGSNQVQPNVSDGCAFLIEAVGTFVLVVTVLHAAVHAESEAGNAAPIAIGWAVLISHMVLVPFTGCGINPARSLGPLVVTSMSGLNLWTRGWWVFFTAPWVGGAFATATYRWIFAVSPVTPAATGDAKQEGSERKHVFDETDSDKGGGDATAHGADTTFEQEDEGVKQMEEAK